MQRLEDGRLLLSATDLTKHVACPHVTTLDLGELEPQPTRDAPQPDGPDDAVHLVYAKGLEHERGYLDWLAAQGRRITYIDGSGAAAAAATMAAMSAGADVIAQACLTSGSWIGYADVLLRVAAAHEPSRFGPWRYDIADTKLARRLTVAALLQMATYAQRLTPIQGVPPWRLLVVTGDRAHHAWAPRDVQAYTRRVVRRLERAITERTPTESAPSSHCKQCRWSSHCMAEWKARDDIGRVAGVRRDHRLALRDAGITTLSDLAASSPADLVGVVGPGVARRLVPQARLQQAEARSGSPSFELLDPGPQLGLGLLPPPHPEDVYLDFEGNPWSDGGRGLEYLAGLGDRRGGFFSWWAHDGAAEKVLVEGLLDDLLARHRRHPGMHVYHYAPYERTALHRMTARYGTREAEFDELLRAQVFVDLYAVVRQGVRISKDSYSIKKLEAFYWSQTRTAGEGEVGDALSSVVEYERWLQTGDPGILHALEEYNRQDVCSTLALHDWLEERRAELLATGAQLARPGAGADASSHPTSPDPEGPEAAARAEEELAQALREAGHPLAAACVGWHRREDRPAWWEFFRFTHLLDDELIADPKALGGLGEPVHVGDVVGATGRVGSRIWRYPLPVQDYTGRRGDSLPDVDDLTTVGQLVAVDPVAGWAEFRIGARREPPRVRGVGVSAPVRAEALRESIQRTGKAVLAGDDTMATRLLRRVVPDGLAAGPGEGPADVVLRVGRALDGQVLAVQGPPGTGKTTAAARLIAALLDEGKTVGVTALSHAVISHLLAGVDRPALHKTGAPPRGRIVWLDGRPDPSEPHRGGVGETGTGTKPTGRTAPRGSDVRAAGTGESSTIIEVRDNAAIAQELASGRARLVGGTAWLWSRPEMAGSVDVLVIDEAGQFSLANAVAVAPAARQGIVLLGDPQQLTQPSQAAHPDGGGVSVLEHLLDGHDTIPADAGVFLDRSYRMHPELTAFISALCYEDRLVSAPDRDRQGVGLPRGSVEEWPGLAGSGLVWIPCRHQGCVADSAVEAQAVAAVVCRLLDGGTYTDHGGTTRPLTPADVLVVAPFNAHVARIGELLPAGVQVGTVDRFQGRQAPVVIYSMASSSAELAPRGVGFLYDVHRLNVALSRAKALAIVIASPDLLDAAVATPEQLRAVNALCLFVEEAREVTAPPPSRDGS